MHVPFEAGMGWVHVAHKNADLLLLVSIASLGLLPLVSIYIIETEKIEEGTATGSNSQPWQWTTAMLFRSTPEVVRSCLRGLVYLAILFPYILALLSTYVSIQLIRGQSLNEAVRSQRYSAGGDKQSHCKGSAFWGQFQKYTKVLKEEDMVNDDKTTTSCHDNSSTRMWRLPRPGVTCSTTAAPTATASLEAGSTGNIPALHGLRTVQGDCAICLHHYQAGEQIIWASNPKCIHAYHTACFQAWMDPWDSPHRRCPCCRQSFFE